MRTPHASYKFIMRMIQNPKRLEGMRAQRWRALGCVVEDRREELIGLRKKPRYAGLIMPFPYERGFTFCPFLRKSFEYNTKVIPHRFKTKEKAFSWLEEHAVAWNRKRCYTIFNGLIMPLYVPILKFMAFCQKWLFLDIRLRLVLLQTFLSVIFGMYHPSNIVLFIFGKVAALLFFCLALIEFLGIIVYPPGHD